MSLLDLFHLDNSDAVMAAVRQWCAAHGTNVTDSEGRKALAVAARLSKSANHSGAELFEALTHEMALLGQLTKADTVLLVEDEPFIAMNIEGVLESEGLSVEYCSTREAALKAIAAKTPSAAILDFHLKDGEATDIAAELQDRQVPIIFCSGVQASDVLLEFRDATWLFKPFDDRQPVNIIKDALDLREFRREMGERA